MDEINKQYKYYSAFKYIQRIADHYNINKDIFENAFFCPSIDLKIEYSNKENNSIPVYYGNKITANEVKKNILIFLNIFNFIEKLKIFYIQLDNK